MHQWMERHRKKWEVTLRGKPKRGEGTKKTVKGESLVRGTKKRKGGERGARWRKVNGGGETGRRLGGAPLVEKRGKRIPKRTVEE